VDDAIVFDVETPGWSRVAFKWGIPRAGQIERICGREVMTSAQMPGLRRWKGFVGCGAASGLGRGCRGGAVLTGKSPSRHVLRGPNPGPPRAARQTHDYMRHGITSLCAALEVATGRVIGECSPTHCGPDFLRFLNRVTRSHPRRALHVIVDNSSTHSTPAVKTWLGAHPRVTLHFTPKGASWIDLVPLGRLERRDHNGV
jgi:hypothetical protein